MTTFLFFHSLRPVLTRRQGHSQTFYTEKVLRIFLVALAESGGHCLFSTHASEAQV